VVASGSWDKTLKLWEARSGRLLTTLKGHVSEVNVVAFAPDGAVVASASWDQTIRLWESGSGRLLATLEGHTRLVRSLAFAPDGASVASASADRTIKLWDARSGRLLATLDGQNFEATAVAFTPDGDFLISAGGDGLLIWNLPSRRCVATMLSLPGGDWITYTPDGYFVGSDDAIQKVMMAFEREFAGSKMRERAAVLLPNPEKVAEALRGSASSTSTGRVARRPAHSTTLSKSRPKLLQG
jgi:WD40 repeat protein